MDCRQAQDEILERLNEHRSEDIPHTAGCPSCAEFARRHSALDARLSNALMPPELSANFRSTLKSRIRRESPSIWPDALPDIVHFGSCAAATLLCALLLPFAAGPVVAVGGTATAITYVLITAARIWFEA